MKRASRLRRLCDLRRLEEQHHASQLAEARQNVQAINEALDLSREQQSRAKSLVRRSIQKGSAEDRVVAIEEIDHARRRQGVLLGAKATAEEQLRQSRNQFLSKRTERRQAETLLDALLQEEARSAVRRGQTDLDEWHRAVQRRSSSKSDEGSTLPS